MTPPKKPGTVPTTAKKPQPKGGSRKGKPNKFTGEVKQMILDALGEAGGVSYLVDRARDPRTASAFLGLVAKVLPMQLTGVDGGAIEQSLTITFRKP